MALTFFSTVPAGSVAIAEAREKVNNFVFGRGWRKAGSKPPTVLHYKRVCLPLDSDCVYIGVGSFGTPGCDVRATQWLNPFELMSCSTNALVDYVDWLDVRMDIDDFVRPLCGKTLLCDCTNGDRCHGYILVKNVRNG